MTESWDWRRNYRVWEANRKVFVYPENWIEPDRRPSSRTLVELRGVVKLARTQRASILFTSTTPDVTLVAGGAVAADLARDLYRVDLNQVVSKFIGETEKNLNLVFESAERARAVLLLDEADALFGKRSEVGDSNDRFANAEVSDLLQRIEVYQGLAILATNSTRKMVEPLARHFRLVIDCPTVESEPT